MSHRFLVLLGVLALGAGLVPDRAAGGQVSAAKASAAAAKNTKTGLAIPRTPWGDPDLQGIWTNTTTTPLERPDDLAGKEFLTDEEWAKRDRQVAEQVSFDRDPSVNRYGNVGLYNETWAERGKLSKRTSLIMDPRDGKVPPLTPEAQKRQAARVEYARAHAFDSWEDIAPSTRCITRGMPTLMMPGFYNHNYHIMQTPGYVVIHVEMIHDARVIPLDRPHLNRSIRQWNGDPRGHWEGDTLVVESTNFTNKANFRGSEENMRLVERFRRVDAETIDYQITVDDPTTFTKPWTISVPMTPLRGLLYEFACHEGNHSIELQLGGARVQEKAREKTQSR